MSRIQAVLLVIAVGAASWSGPLVRLADDAAPIAVAFWRTALGALILLPFAISRHRDELRTLRRRDVGLLVGSGLFLALHFVTWFASLSLTTVAAAALLVTATPIFVALFSGIVLRERVGGRSWLGIAVAIGGGSMVALADLGDISTAGLGNLLALSGSATYAGYILIGRRMRRETSLLTYAVAVYGTCAILLLIAAMATGIRLVGFEAPTWIAIFAITAGPQLIGHTTLNFLLEHVDATKVTVASLGEPVLASVIAGFLFAEIPGFLVLPGGVLLLIGIWTVMSAGRQAELAAPSTRPLSQLPPT